MLYLLDANVLITAHRDYYAMDQVPEFWEWLLDKASNNVVKIPREIMEEIKAGKKDDDALLDWFADKEHQKMLLLDEAVNGHLLQQVVENGYAPDLTDDELEQIGRDPFLIAYTMAQTDRCVVTIEVSKPRRQRQNKKIPDVCDFLGVKWCNTYKFTRELGFTTSWRSTR